MSKKYFPILMLLLSFSLFACTNKEEKADKLYREGKRLFYKHDIRNAITTYEEAINYNDSKDYYYIALGHCYMNLKEYKKAIEIYKKAIQLNPKNAEAYYSRSLCWRYLGDKEKECEDLHQAQQLGKTNLSDRLKHCL